MQCQLSFADLPCPITNERHSTAPETIDWDWLPSNFPVPTEDIPQQYEVRDALLQRLEVLRCAPASSAGYPSHAQIDHFTAWLLDSQRTVRQQHIRSGSWGIPEELAIPSDAFVDFVLVPTYAAVAWLSLIRQDFPELARSSQERIDRAIEKGLRFSRTKNLRGHGYDANRESLEAVRILALGKVFTFVRDRERTHGSFADVMNKVEYSILHQMPNAGDWSQTNGADRQYTLSLLRGGDANDALVAPPVHAKWRGAQWASYLDRVLKEMLSRFVPTAAATVTDELSAHTETIRQQFEAEKPQYAVFGEGRRISVALETLPVELDISPSLHEATGRIAAGEWLPPQPDYVIEQALQPLLQERLPRALSAALANDDTFSDEPFAPYVRSVDFGDGGSVQATMGVVG